ncbi:MAG: hypothetical protein DRP84_09680, partial [Spirochaetes bacterium]
MSVIIIVLTILTLSIKKTSSEILDEREVIQGTAFAKGTTVYFDEFGRLKYAYLATEQEIQGTAFAKGTT